MFSKTVFVFCAQILLIKSALSCSCSSRGAVATSPGIAAPTWGGLYGLDDRTPYGLAAPSFAAFGTPACGASYGIAASAWSGPFGLTNPAFNAPIAGPYAPLDFVASGIDFTPTRGGSFIVTSGSVIAPTGISLVSENAYEGRLDVVGEMPFVGTVGVEGLLPTAGAGVVGHSCGNGLSVIASENIVDPFGLGVGPAVAPGIAPGFAPGFGYRSGYCGCGL